MWLSTMEAEIIRWTCDLYNGDKDTCGILTSGGTESILLAMLAYKVQGK
jgi:sphinganine-1-phosphate aldolase